MLKDVRKTPADTMYLLLVSYIYGNKNASKHKRDRLFIPCPSPEFIIGYTKDQKLVD